MKKLNNRINGSKPRKGDLLGKPWVFILKSKQLSTLLLTISLTILLINIVSAVPIYYDINLESNEDQITINTIDIIFDQFNKSNYGAEFNTHTLEITNFENNILTTIPFSIPDIEIFDIVDEETGEIVDGGTNNLTETNFNLQVPYNENAKELTIYNEQHEEITNTSLAHFSKSSKAVIYMKTISTDEIPQTKTKEEQITITTEQDSIIVWQILLGFLIILVIVFIILIFKKKKK